MAVELLKADTDPTRKRELERDIAELDALIDEILLASRLDASASQTRTRRWICSPSPARSARATRRRR